MNRRRRFRARRRKANVPRRASFDGVLRLRRCGLVSPRAALDHVTVAGDSLRVRVGGRRREIPFADVREVRSSLAPTTGRAEAVVLDRSGKVVVWLGDAEWLDGTDGDCLRALAEALGVPYVETATPVEGAGSPVPRGRRTVDGWWTLLLAVVSVLTVLASCGTSRDWVDAGDPGPESPSVMTTVLVVLLVLLSVVVAGWHVRQGRPRADGVVVLSPAPHVTDRAFRRRARVLRRGDELSPADWSRPDVGTALLPAAGPPPAPGAASGDRTASSLDATLVAGAPRPTTIRLLVAASLLSGLHLVAVVAALGSASESEHAGALMWVGGVGAVGWAAVAVPQIGHAARRMEAVWRKNPNDPLPRSGWGVLAFAVAVGFPVWGGVGIVLASLMLPSWMPRSWATGVLVVLLCLGVMSALLVAGVALLAPLRGWQVAAGAVTPWWFSAAVPGLWAGLFALRLPATGLTTSLRATGLVTLGLLLTVSWRARRNRRAEPAELGG